MLGLRAGGTESLFPYQMAHEQAMQYTAADRPPPPRAFPLIREVVEAGRPEFAVRTSDEVPVEHHDMVNDSDHPVYHSDGDYDSPKVYALRNRGRYTFLVPVRHNDTGETGWLRGITDSDPDSWRFYEDDDIDSAIAGIKPRRERPVPAEQRYKRQRATGKPAPLEEGDVPLDEEGHQLVEPRRDTWSDLGALRGYADEPPEEKPWTDLNWAEEPDMPKEPDSVTRHNPEDLISEDRLPWWATA